MDASLSASDDRSVTLARANALALRALLPVLAVLLLPFLLLHGPGALGSGAWWWATRPLLGVSALLLGVLLHEGLHAAVWLLAGRVPRASVSFGVRWEALAPYAHCTAPMRADAYRMAAALPGAALGLAPVLAAWASGSGAMLLLGLVFTLAAAGDAVVLWAVRDVPGEALVRDHPERVGCLVEAAPGGPAEPPPQGGVRPAANASDLMLDTPIRTTHLDPALDGTDRSASWEAGISYEAFLPTAEKNVGLWTSGWERARIPEDLVARAEAVPGQWRLLVLSADWCGDASNTVPVMARFAEAAANVDLRLLDRDEHLDLMDAHLTGGTARSIPVAILLDGDGRERGWWGPRPLDLQTWVKREGMAMETDARYREVRKWYARDHGRTTLEEIVGLMESAGGKGLVA